MGRIETLFCAIILSLISFGADADTLRICSDPNNLPFSNRQKQGFEDAIARLAARDLGDTLQYAYALENESFIRRTLAAGKCDVLMGVPAGLGEVDTTKPYYSSTYVFVSRKAEGAPVGSFSDPRLRKLRVGVHLIGDESTPPVLALAREHIVDNVRGFVIESGYDRPNPPGRPIEAVETGAIDVAAVWGPFGGYFAKLSPVPLSVTPVSDGDRFAPLRFEFPISIGVRKGDVVLRDRLDGFLMQEHAAIRRILEAYGVPLVATGKKSDE